MPNPDEATERIREMIIEMGDDDLLAQFDSAVKALDERDKRIAKTLEDLMEEVDELLLRMDSAEDNDAPCDDEPVELG